MPDLNTMTAKDFLAWLDDNTKDAFFLEDARVFISRGITDLDTITRFQHLSHELADLPESLVSAEGLEAVNLIGAEVAKRDPDHIMGWMEVARQIDPGVSYHGSSAVIEAMLAAGREPADGLRIAEIASGHGVSPDLYGFRPQVTPEAFQALLASEINDEGGLNGYLDLGYTVEKAIELAGQKLTFRHMEYIERFKVPQGEWAHVKAFRFQWLAADDNAPGRLRQVAESRWGGKLAQGGHGIDTDSAIALGKAGIHDEETYKGWLQAMYGKDGWRRPSEWKAEPDIVALAGMGIKKSNLSEYRMCGAKDTDQMRQIAARLTAQRCKELRDRFGRAKGGPYGSERKVFPNIEALFRAEEMANRADAEDAEGEASR
jgi:hypothetical protein